MDVPLSKLNLEKLIKGQLAESIRSADVLSLLRKMVDSAPANEETEVIRKKLEQVTTYYETLNEEQKVEFARVLKDGLSGKLAQKIEEMPMDLSHLEDSIQWAVWSQIYLVGAAAVIIVLLIVFFGYKLYKSLKDKEKKREEKKKQKQLKKKK